MRVLEGEGFTLRPFEEKDAEKLAAHLNNKKIYDMTLNIPYPYTLEHAQEWIKTCQDDTIKQQRFAIEVEGEIVGSVALEEIEEEQAEIGYWLAEPFWGKGVMTKAVCLLIEYAFGELGLPRVYAYIYEENIASQRVLEKTGFTREKRLPGHVIKEGRPRNDLLYGRNR